MTGGPAQSGAPRGAGQTGTTQRGSWLEPGTRLNDLYEIDEGIASGGMGEIYRGHAILTGDLVAIKTIRSDVAETEAAMTMFRKEAQALHNLYHEAIVRYYVFSVDPTVQRPYLAMEYVSGPSLSNMVRNGPLGYEAVRVLGARLASGLQAAHERGIIHRDISPDNVILPHGDVAQAKIIDFGIARQTRGGEGTVVGDGFAGKYNYVSPEQLGLFGGDVGATSDIYSLGLVLVEAATGRALDMRGSPVEVIEKRRVVPDLSGVDDRLRALLERMLTPDPGQRMGSMTEVAAWLRRGTLTGLTHGYGTEFHEPTVVSVRPQTMAGNALPRPSAPPQFQAHPQPHLQSHLQSSPSPPRRRLGLWIGLPAGLLALGAVGGGAYWFAQGPGPAPAPVVARTEPRTVAPEPPAPPDFAVLQVTPGDMQAAATQIARRLGEKVADPCALVDPVIVGDDRAAIDGYARSAEAFSTLRSDLRSAHDVMLDVRLNQVTAAQCPMLAFVSGARGNASLVPAIELVGYTITAGGAISGELFGPLGAYVSLLAAFADGSVRVVVSSMRLTGQSTPFAFTPDARLLPPGAALLLVAIASSAPLDLLRPDAVQPAERLLAQMQERAEASGMRLAAVPAYVQVK